jgi:hypothetical protein
VNDIKHKEARPHALGESERVANQVHTIIRGRHYDKNSLHLIHGISPSPFPMGKI